MPTYQSGPGVIYFYSSATNCQGTTGVTTPDCREVPDLAATADGNHGFVSYFSGAWITAGGTSGRPRWSQGSPR